MSSFLKDAAHGVRLLVRDRSFTVAALLTLALCTGANTAVFSVVHGLLLKPLPFDGADRLVTIYNSYPAAGVERGGAAAPDYFDRRGAIASLEEVAMLQDRGMTIGEAGRPERVEGMAVTPSFLAMLGVQPVLGRTFLEEEGEPGANRQALLGWSLWQERYAGDANVLGTSIRINDSEHTIVGVLPRDFVWEGRSERLWIPLAFSEEQRSDDARHSNNWTMIGKLRPGATVERLQQEIDAQNAGLLERLPQFRDILEQVGFRTVVAEYRSDVMRDVRGTLLLLQAGVVLVLLIGCVNIANLVLVRSTSRHRELATRSALGAARGRLARQLLTESVVLAVVGGALGLLVGRAAIGAFAPYAAEHLPRGAAITFDATTLGAAFAVALLAGLLFGALPVARLFGADLSSVFRDEGRTGTAGRGTQAWRSGLVVAQVSLAFTLLVGAGLLITSFAQTMRVRPGFDAGGVLTASVSLPFTRYGEEETRRRFVDQLLFELRAVPGVAEAAVTNALPFASMNSNAVTAEGHEPRPEDPLVAPTVALVSEGYFEALRIPLQSGRSLEAGDRDGGLDVAVIDRQLADRFWPGTDPVGRRIAQGVDVDGSGLRFFTIVGVTGATRTRELTEDDPVGTLYLPARQMTPGQFHVVIRASTTPAAVTSGVRAALAALDPDLPLHDVRTMDERLSRSTVNERLRMLLIAGFGALALMLAAIGIYGVLAWTVAQRSAEIGIRMALGSSATQAFRMVLVQGTRLLAIGLVVGIAGSLALGRAVSSMLYGVSPGDPLVLGAVLALLSVTALAACVLPARRAMKVDPLAAIRAD